MQGVSHSPGQDRKGSPPERLIEMGAKVDVVPIYETVIPEDEAEHLSEIFADGKIDAVTFTSSSTVTNFVQIAGPDKIPSILEGVTVACIGPITAKTAEKAGLTVHVVSEEYTIPGLVSALRDYFEN